MNVNILAISVGNTRTRVGLFRDGKLIRSQAVANANLAAELPEILAHDLEELGTAADAGLLLASVNPPVAQQVTEMLHQAAPGRKVWRVEEDVDVPIGRQLDRESIVGQDRLLNAAAAYDTLKQACVVVDAGTATVVDFIDGAGTFHGGAIAPGAQMMLDALHQHTAQLPEVTLARPEEPIGHNTVEAMRTAIFHGQRGLVRELVEQYAEVAGSYPMVVATGGNAELLFKDYDLVERIVPDLTLRGLAVTWHHATTQADDEDE